MSETASWRDRYLELAEQSDAERDSHQQAERELLRLITRLCLACQGFDEILDPHLKRLHKAARDGGGGKLQQQAQDLGDALVQANDERLGGGLLERVLQHSRLGSGQIKQALKQWRRCAAAPSKVSDKELDELAALLFPSADGEADAASGGGLFSRLLQRGGTPPNQVLLELIAAMQWPNALQQDVQQLQSSLGPQAADDAWIEVVRQISDMAVNAVDRVSQDAQAAGVFLEQLSERLQAIDSFVNEDGERRRVSREAGMKLGRAVSDEVGGLSDDMRSHTDLEGLRAQVLSALDRIQGHVAGHIGEEAQRSMEAERQAALMGKQLEQLEKETYDLRRQVARSHHQAMSDPLTNLPNRRAYEERAAQELARWKRFGEPLSLVVWDIDNFKQINDSFGHKAGDRALALIARILKESLRETDFIARYGGEEFVVLLPGAAPEDALKVAELMRKAVASAGMHSHNKPVEITISGGLGSLQAEESIEQLFERADKAMYQAKRQGKNRCLSAD